ncbi:glycosyltransferase family 2 protein [Oceanicoccus sp. KOV_DT_Chl]|uniref:glycosyltransferase family 2 protein n=1 Tax=Oceanicoccus sp. KOV_DT_Chl TaxID=1904639 RepID=UPI000C7B47D1|nr:glycosyltransferase family 2 protein [Oceanicoccus sp. KOV_DT_Chl]
MKVSVVIPAKNEAESLLVLLPAIKVAMPMAELIVVNDGSDDNTSAVCETCEVVEVRHPYSKGNGAAIKSGAKKATGDVIVFMDGDGQHKPNDIPRLLAEFDKGYDMVVGARNDGSQASVSRLAGNKIYNRLATFMVGHKVEDLTSGFRAVRKDKFLQFIYMLPNGFSYPTTITMSFFRAGFTVKYIPIEAEKRLGSSHINLLRDGTKFLLIIFKVGTLYSPLKIFFPISIMFFITGVCYYGYTYTTMGRFTNMSALLFISAMLVFLMGLVSEQITTLLYKDEEKNA